MDKAILKTLTIGPQVSVRDAIGAIDRSRRQIALVVDDGGRLLATVTDGDVRRGILKGIDLDGPVSQVMHTAPTTVTARRNPRSDQRATASSSAGNSR